MLDLAGLRFLTDPTFDPPGSYEPRPGVRLSKTHGPARTPDEIGPVDVVLLSHDQHVDNLDVSGRELLTRVPTVLTTESGAERLGARVAGLKPWSEVSLERPGGGTLRITGVPAQHGPDGSERLVGDVIGFVLGGDGLLTIYVSGDNASLAVVREIAERVEPIDVALLFAGGAQMPYLGDAYLTLSSALAAEAATLLGARVVVPLHFEGWAHFSEGAPALRHAFRDAGLCERLVIIPPGKTATI